ncbi:MAG TPA: hypothetical protein VMH81_13765 [Bryobacteraceae bacterium]|nr:hypothetical protein [Bryobacteraceae bacterium]
MRISSFNTVGFGVAVLLSLVLTLNVVAKDKAPNMTSVQGKVFMIDRDSSTIMVDAKSGARRLVVYSPDTKFNYGRSGKGKESSLDQILKTQYISCIGASDDRARLVAKECVHRESK